MRSSNDMPLDKVIDSFLNRFHIKHKMRESQIKREWEQIVGKTIANHTTGLYFKDRKLFIKVDSAPLKHELVFMKEKIAEILNQRFEDSVVEDIIIR